MNRRTAAKHSFMLQKLKRPIAVRNIDKTNNSGEAITYQVELNMYYKGYVKRIRMDICYDLAKMAKLLFIFLFFSFTLDLLHRRECRKVFCHKCHIVTVIWQEVTVSHYITLYDRLHDRHWKVVHRPCSSCISNIKSNRNSIKFFLSTQTWRVIKSSRLSCYNIYDLGKTKIILEIL